MKITQIPKDKNESVDDTSWINFIVQDNDKVVAKLFIQDLDDGFNCVLMAGKKSFGFAAEEWDSVITKVKQKLNIKRTIEFTTIIKNLSFSIYLNGNIAGRLDNYMKGYIWTLRLTGYDSAMNIHAETIKEAKELATSIINHEADDGLFNTWLAGVGEITV